VYNKNYVAKWVERQNATLRQTYDGKTMPVNSAVIAEMSLPGGKILQNPWNCAITKYSLNNV
jgi:hypothetical protein